MDVVKPELVHKYDVVVAVVVVVVAAAAAAVDP